MIELSQALSRDSYIAYDPDHPSQRLYLLLNPTVRAVLKRRLWEANEIEPTTLDRLGRLAGGRHGKMGGYPPIEVKPIGILTAVVYFTNKQGDGPSYYIHQMAEISSVFPILAVDVFGRLWLAGGNTTSPTPGITD